MPSISSCPSCRAAVRVPDELAGRLVRCPTCNATFMAGGGVSILEPPPEIPVREPLAEPAGPAEVFPYREKPGKVQAIAAMTLAGGIWALLVALGAGAFSSGVCCMWPGTYYSLVLGILAVLRGANLLGERAYQEPAPTVIAIMQIVNIINADFPNVVLGILTLVFLGDEEVKRYFRA